ncbi:MAG: hypothetical protein H6661_07400 [Ardenticatenaceae bacterium]|nr:hypothetical protein [Ardenticatenaceae bacterium]
MPDSKSAVNRIYRSVKYWSANAIFHVSILVTLGYAFSNGSIDGNLFQVFGLGVGVNLLSDVIRRLASGEDMSEEQIQQAVQKALGESNLDALLTDVEFKRTISKLFERQELTLSYVIAEANKDTREKLLKLMEQNQLLTANGLRAIYNRFERGEKQNEEILALLRQLISAQDRTAPQAYEPPPLPKRGILAEPGSSLPPGSRMLYRRNPFFTGRADDLLQLAETFLYEENGRHVIITQTAVAAGMGGIGKTQLAVEFAYRYGRYFPGGVFWLSFGLPENITNEIAACGGPDGLDLAPGFTDLPLDDQVKMVQRAWHEPVARLLIFDNCEEETLLAEWRPQHGGSHVLVTSRRQQWDRALGVSHLQLAVLPRAESIILLRQFMPDLSDSDADAIANEVGDLPLALHLAGSFLASYSRITSPTAYLEKLRDKQILQHASMLGHGTDYSPTGHDLDVARTFAVSFEKLDRANETDALALTLLARLAYLAPGEPIPGDLRQALVSIDKDNEDSLLQIEDAWRRLLALWVLWRWSRKVRCACTPAGPLCPDGR